MALRLNKINGFDGESGGDRINDTDENPMNIGDANR